MYVYLLHFNKPISANHTCQHYIGYTKDLEERIRLHMKGQPARLTQVAKERGIGFTIARVWQGDRSVERKLKNRKNAPKLCPLCSETHELKDIHDLTIDDINEALLPF